MRREWSDEYLASELQGNHILVQQLLQLVLVLRSIMYAGVPKS